MNPIKRLTINRTIGDILENCTTNGSLIRFCCTCSEQTNYRSTIENDNNMPVYLTLDEQKELKKLVDKGEYAPSHGHCRLCARKIYKDYFNMDYDEVHK